MLRSTFNVQRSTFNVQRSNVPTSFRTHEATHTYPTIYPGFAPGNGQAARSTGLTEKLVSLPFDAFTGKILQFREHDDLHAVRFRVISTEAYSITLGRGGWILRTRMQTSRALVCSRMSWAI